MFSRLWSLRLPNALPSVFTRVTPIFTRMQSTTWLTRHFTTTPPPQFTLPRTLDFLGRIKLKLQAEKKPELLEIQRSLLHETKPLSQVNSVLELGNLFSVCDAELHADPALRLKEDLLVKIFPTAASFYELRHYSFAVRYAIFSQALPVIVRYLQSYSAMKFFTSCLFLGSDHGEIESVQTLPEIEWFDVSEITPSVTLTHNQVLEFLELADARAWDSLPLFRTFKLVLLHKINWQSLINEEEMPVIKRAVFLRAFFMEWLDRDFHQILASQISDAYLVSAMQDGVDAKLILEMCPCSLSARYKQLRILERFVVEPEDFRDIVLACLVHNPLFSLFEIMSTDRVWMQTVLPNLSSFRLILSSDMPMSILSEVYHLLGVEHFASFKVEAKLLCGEVIANALTELEKRFILHAQAKAFRFDGVAHSVLGPFSLR